MFYVIPRSQKARDLFELSFVPSLTFIWGQSSVVPVPGSVGLLCACKGSLGELSAPCVTHTLKTAESLNKGPMHILPLDSSWFLLAPCDQVEHFLI